MNNPLISVVMPAYNAEQYIADAISSVQAQTYANWELIIVDDGSEDNTAKIVDEWVKKDTRVTYLYQNRGRQGKARNLAIKKSKGEYIAFLDADDLWAANKLQVQVEIIESRPDIDLIFTCGFNLLPEGNVTEMNILVKEWCWANDRDLLLSGNQIPILSVLTRKKAVENVGLFSEQPEIQNAEDYHLWIRLLNNGSFLSISEKLFCYRIHPQQATYKNSHIEIPVACSLINLISSGVINYKNKIVRDRLKWLIFQSHDLSYNIQILKVAFPNRAPVLSLLSFLNTLLPNSSIVKKLTFHYL